MLQMIRTLAASVAILPLVAGLALAQGGATPLDQALAAQDAAAPDRRVEARRVVEEAFLGSTLHLVRLSDGAGGSRFLIGRQGDLPALSAFDTPERLIAWTHANFTADQREQMGEFSGPAADFLALLNERTGGDLVLAVNAGAEHSLSIDPVFFRFLAAQARQSADLPAVADGTPAPVTPLEWHAYIREQGDVDAEAAGLALRHLVDGQLFYVPFYAGEARDDIETLSTGETEDASTQNEDDARAGRLAVEGVTGASGRVYRLAVFDRRDLAEAYAGMFETEHEAGIEFRVIRGIDLMQALTVAVPVAINAGSPYTLVIVPDHASTEAATD